MLHLYQNKTSMLVSEELSDEMVVCNVQTKVETVLPIQNVLGDKRCYGYAVTLDTSYSDEPYLTEGTEIETIANLPTGQYDYFIGDEKGILMVHPEKDSEPVTYNAESENVVYYR